MTDVTATTSAAQRLVGAGEHHDAPNDAIPGLVPGIQASIRT